MLSKDYVEQLTKEQYNKHLRISLYICGGVKDKAEDVLQQTLLKAYNGNTDILSTDAFMNVCLKNTFLEIEGKGRNRVFRNYANVEDTHKTTGVTPHEIVAAKEALVKILEKEKRFPDKQRKVLLDILLEEEITRDSNYSFHHRGLMSNVVKILEDKPTRRMKYTDEFILDVISQYSSKMLFRKGNIRVQDFILKNKSKFPRSAEAYDRLPNTTPWSSKRKK